VPTGGGKTELAGHRHHQLLGARVVDAEGVGGHDDAHAPVAQRLHRRPHVLAAECVTAEKDVAGRDPAPGGQLDVADVRLAARQPRLDRAPAHAKDTHGGDITFEQRVGRLRRAVRDEDDVARAHGGAGEHATEGLDHAGRHTLASRVRRRDHRLPDDRVSVVVHHHGFREGAADVDADPDEAAHRATS